MYKFLSFLLFIMYSTAGTLVNSDSVILDLDFTRTEEIPVIMKPAQKTRWTVEGGLLQGLPSTAEYQKSVKGHNGSAAKLDIVLKNYQTFIFECEFKFEGKNCIIELGHRLCRIMIDRKNCRIQKGTKTEASQKTGPGPFHKLYCEVYNDKVLVSIDKNPAVKISGIKKIKKSIQLSGPSGGKIFFKSIKLTKAVPVE